MSNAELRSKRMIIVTCSPVDSGTYEPLLAKANCVSDLVLTEELVKQQLELVDESKSPDPDSVHPRLLRMFSSLLAYPLFIIFSKSLQTGILPNDWKTAHIVPIHRNAHVF